MGTASSAQHDLSHDRQDNYQQNHSKISNWKLLNKNQTRQILQSKRAGLLVERYAAIKNQQTDIFAVHSNQQNIFEWRNTNPNSSVIVSILSKQITDKNSPNFSGQTYKNSSCSYNLCPHEDSTRYLHVVTQRILRLKEIQQMILIMHQINNHQFLKQPEQKQKKIQKQRAVYQPFLNMTINKQEAISILVDWVKGIQSLCYKFGYFKVNYEHLGITMHKRGNVWINDNFALNVIQHKNKINISTAQEKFKFEKETLNKIFTYAQGLNWFKKATSDISRFNLDKFDDLYAYFQMNPQNRELWKRQKFKQFQKNDGNGSQKFLIQNSKNSLISHKRRTLSSDQYIFQSCERLNMIHSDYNENRFKSPQQRSIIRSNTQNNLAMNEHKSSLPTFEKKVMCAYKHECRQTAPSNQYIKQSFNSHKNQLISNQNQRLSPNKFQQPRNNKQSFYKSQIKHVPIQIQPVQVHNERKRVHYDKYRNLSFDFHQGCFRSQNNENQTERHKKQNISMDMGYLMGPQKHQRIYKALKKEKIALIDSMVMVQQQSQEIQDQMRDKIKMNLVLQESVILRGLDQEQLNSYQYDNKPNRIKNR